VVNEYTLASDLDRQLRDLPVRLRKILLSMILVHPRLDMAHSPARYRADERRRTTRADRVDRHLKGGLAVGFA